MSGAAAASRPSGCFPASFRLSSVSSMYNGVCRVAKRVAAEVCSLPSSTLSMAGWVVTETIGFKPLTAAVLATQTVYNSAVLVQQYRSLNGDGWTSTALKIVVFGLLVQEAAGAITVVGLCPNVVYNNIANGLNCYESGKPVNECIHLLGSDSRQITQMTHHDSDFGTLILQHKDKCCFSSSIEPKKVITCCFDNTFQKRKISEEAIDFTNLRFNELPSRYSKLTIKTIDDSSSSDSPCVINVQRPADYNLGNDPICLLMASRSSKKITQICMDPKNPFAHTVKAIAKEEFPMDFSASPGKPLLFVVSNVKNLGLDPFPDPPSQDEL